jgi:hypothetical protein
VISQRVSAFAGSRQYLCAVIVTGQVQCLVANGAKPPSTAELDEIATGEQSFMCGLAPAGAVRCWGLTSTFWNDGKATAPDGALVQIPERVSALASGGELHMCALSALGHVWCWGDNPVALGASAAAWGPVNLGTRP